MSGLVAVAFFQRRRKSQNIAATRANENFSTFCDEFIDEKIPQDILVSVYTKLQQWMSDVVANFPISGNDSFAHTYQMADEDLDDIMINIIMGCGRHLPWLAKPVKINTVREMVLFIAACPAAPSVRRAT